MNLVFSYSGKCVTKTTIVYLFVFMFLRPFQDDHVISLHSINIINYTHVIAFSNRPNRHQYEHACIPNK